MPNDSFQLRKAKPDDLSAIVEVCSAALGWHDPNFDRSLFEWKHLTNPFGESLLIVAEDDAGIAAVRPFMKWNFRTAAAGQVRAARAVDTATHPRAQGRGLFTQLTEMGLAELSNPESPHHADFIFNTPNEKSLAGYLKMGWVERGPIPFGFRLRSPLSITKLARSRTRADKPSIPTPQIGIEVDQGLELVDEHDPCPLSTELHTNHTIESLRWRYCEAPIGYRFLPGPDGSGLIVRLRKRGASKELLVAQQCGPMSKEVAGRAVRNAMRTVKADHCIGWAGLGGTVSSSKPGPTLAIRNVRDGFEAPTNMSWQPGDIELF